MRKNKAKASGAKKDSKVVEMLPDTAEGDPIDMKP